MTGTAPPRRAGAMRRGALALALLTTIGAAAEPGSGAADILYLTAEEWRASPPTRKIALSTSFMRLYCGDIRMSPAELVSCLDGDGRSDAIFDRALSCSALLRRH